MSDLERLRDGICPFTGEHYNCGRCEKYKELEHDKRVGTYHIHMGLCFEGMLLDGKRGQRELHRYVGGSKTCTLIQCVDYYTEILKLGATTVPIGMCDNFCYRRGCMGHPMDKEKTNG